MRLAISIGDITGIGPEVTLKALAQELEMDDCRYLLLGDGLCLQKLNEQLRLGLELRRHDKAIESGRLSFHSPDEELPADLAPGSAAAARATLEWLEDGARRCLDGEADALVKSHRAFVFRAGDGLQRDRASIPRGFLEGSVQRPAQPERPRVVPHRDEVDIAIAGRRDEAEQITDDLPARRVARYEGRVAELHEEHRVVQIPG